jgi:hypothetical protein
MGRCLIGKVGLALGIRVKNFQGTKISMFDMNKKQMFRDLKGENIAAPP